MHAPSQPRQLAPAAVCCGVGRSQAAASPFLLLSSWCNMAAIYCLPRARPQQESCPSHVGNKVKAGRGAYLEVKAGIRGQTSGTEEADLLGGLPNGGVEQRDGLGSSRRGRKKPCLVHWWPRCCGWKGAARVLLSVPVPAYTCSFTRTYFKHDTRLLPMQFSVAERGSDERR